MMIDLNMAALHLWTPAAAAVIVLAAALCYWIWGRDQSLKPVDTDAIPDGLSALEVGTAVDGIVQGEDLEAQIVEWARKGYLHIVLEENTWQLQRMKEPETLTGYEKEAWDRLFEGGQRERISSPADRKLILGAARILQKGAEDLFENGEKRMTDAVSSRIALGVWCTGALCLLVCGIIAGCLAGMSAYSIAPVAIAAALPAVAAAWLSGWVQRFYQVRSRKKNIFVIAVILLADFVMGAGVHTLLNHLSAAADMIVIYLIVSGIFCAMIAPFVGRRSRYGHRILCELMGLRDALAEDGRWPDRQAGEDAESYFFRMLPYAQTLGVGDAFVQRFAEEALSVPEWLSWERTEMLNARSVWACLILIRDQLLENDDSEGEQ